MADNELVFIGKRGKCAAWCAYMLLSLVYSGKGTSILWQDLDRLSPDACAVIIQGFTSFLMAYLLDHAQERDDYFRAVSNGTIPSWLGRIFAPAPQRKPRRAPPKKKRKRTKTTVITNNAYGNESTPDWIWFDRAAKPAKTDHSVRVRLQFYSPEFRYVEGLYSESAKLSEAVRRLVKLNQEHYPAYAFDPDSPNQQSRPSSTSTTSTSTPRVYQRLVLPNHMDVVLDDVYDQPLQAFAVTKPQSPEIVLTVLSFGHSDPKRNDERPTQTIRMMHRYWYDDPKRGTSIQVPVGHAPKEPLVSQLEQDQKAIPRLSFPPAPGYSGPAQVAADPSASSFAELHRWIELQLAYQLSTGQRIPTQQPIVLSFVPQLPSSIQLTWASFDRRPWSLVAGESSSVADRHRRLEQADAHINRYVAKQVLLWAQELPTRSKTRPIIVDRAEALRGNAERKVAALVLPQESIQLLCLAAVFTVTLWSLLRDPLADPPVVLLTGDADVATSLFEYDPFPTVQDRMLRDLKDNNQHPEDVAVDLSSLQAQHKTSLISLLNAWPELTSLMRVSDSEILSVYYALRQKARVFYNKIDRGHAQQEYVEICVSREPWKKHMRKHRRAFLYLQTND